jgi:FAD/FMN-containing dehydrogenase
MAINLNDLRASFSGRLISDEADMAPYLLDWRKRYQGRAYAVAEPDTAAEVAKVVRWCAAHQVPIVPQGGNTGLSGGATPNASGHAVVLSLKRLNKIRAVDTQNNTLIAEAGCILQTVQEAASHAGRLFPLSLASQGTCTVGGNLSTNAGGVNVLRYGNARELCLGLEVVTAQGELWDGLRGLRKDNTGYDLRDVFIGAEGTLGIITAAVLKIYPQPIAKLCALVALDSPDAALKLLSLAQSRLGANLTAFELISRICIDFVLQHSHGCRDPLDAPSPWYVLLEVVNFESPQNCQAALEALLEAAFEQALISDGVVSSNQTQFAALWALRENISEAQAAEGQNIKHDIALPISSIAQFLTNTNAALTHAFPHVRIVAFGHLGDGNLHYNVSPGVAQNRSENYVDFLQNQEAINLIVHDAGASFNGSVSAEHGLGVLRRDEAARYKSPIELRLMRVLKTALDPHNLLNPEKILPLA